MKIHQKQNTKVRDDVWSSLVLLKFRSLTAPIKQYATIVFFIACLCVLVGFFYYASFIHLTTFSPLLIAIIFGMATDGAFLSLRLFRKKPGKRKLSFDPRKLSVLITCYNGEKILPQTIEEVLTKVPASQIFVISDNSRDKTVDIARSYGAHVFQNEKNYNKGLSINKWVTNIKTPYCLILDDDTHIKNTFLPTNLLDERYSAVAFNVMPEKTVSMVNQFQQYEYRKSMHLGKLLSAEVGAIGNVSGALGLFHTKDLIEQADKHSGQFGGEDQQRTMLIHLESEGKGITFMNSTVYTEAPDTFKALFKQRAFKWGMSVHETFVLCVRMILSPKTHYLLKTERTYVLFVLLTDPLRMLLIPFLFLQPITFLTLYTLYLFISFFAWLKTGQKDPVWVVLLSPIYNIFKNLARFVAHFYWFKIKYDYIVRNKFHRLITKRKLIGEYAFLALVLFSFWGMTARYASINFEVYTDYAVANIARMRSDVHSGMLAIRDLLTPAEAYTNRND